MKRVGTVIKRKLETMEIEVGSTSSSDETAESEIVQQLCLNKEEIENTNSHNFTKKLDKENNC